MVLATAVVLPLFLQTSNRYESKTIDRSFKKDCDKETAE